MNKFCKTCDVELELCKGYEPYSIDHMDCPICNGTYNIDELNRCECKYAHWNDRCQWPTLEGRLNQATMSRIDAIKQLETMMPLSDIAKKYLEKGKK